MIQKTKTELLVSSALTLANIMPSAIQTWGQYKQAREQRLALEAKLDAEIRTAEIHLEALYAKLEASSNFLALQQKENSEKRAFLMHGFDSLHSMVQQYVAIHAQLLLSAKSEEERDHAAEIWHVIEPFVLHMGKITSAISSQTLGWLDL